MRILSLSNCPLNRFQGSGYVILGFCEGLQQSGHTVELFGPESYEVLRFLKKGKSYRQAIGMLLFSMCFLLKNRLDVVEFYGGESWLAVLFLTKIYKRSFLVVSHSNGLETQSETLLKKFHCADTPDGSQRKWYQFNQARLMQKSFECADAVVTVSSYERDYALKQNYKDSFHVLSIENPLPCDFLDLKVNYDRGCTVGYCGSWIPRKGIETIKLDITRLLGNFPDCTFKLIGVGESFNKETHFPEEVCSRIEVIPFVEDKNELCALYQKLSVLVMPSVYESFGLVAAEAMACGCAVVTSKTGFAAGLKHRTEVFTIEHPISPLLYEGVAELLLNEPLRLQIAKAGYQVVQNLHWDRASARLESAYLRWLEEIRYEAKYFT